MEYRIIPRALWHKLKKEIMSRSNWKLVSEMDNNFCLLPNRLHKELKHILPKHSIKA